MTAPVAAKPSILATLLADLESIENSFHSIAEPQLAIGAKMREILTEAVRVIEAGDVSAIAAKVEAALEQISAGVKKAEDLGAKFEAGLATLEALAERVAALEPKKDAGESVDGKLLAGATQVRPGTGIAADNASAGTGAVAGSAAGASAGTAGSPG